MSSTKTFQLMREREAAEMLSVSPRLLQKLRLTGGGPLYVKISGSAVRYRLSDLEAYIAERVRHSTSDR